MISVIIPVFNEKENLNRLLPRLGILSQSHDIEILVSVGECSQNYSNCLKGLERVRLVDGKRKGRAKQMNDGVTAAEGNILVFLHADVLPPDNFFEDIKLTIASGYDAGFFSYHFDKDSFFLRINASFTKREGAFTGGGDQCLFIKKAIFEQMNGFNENQELMEDFEFFARMKKRKLNYRIVPNDLTVSARKYEKNSYFKINLTNLLLVLLFKLGYAPRKLKKLHDRLLDVNYN